MIMDSLGKKAATGGKGHINSNSVRFIMAAVVVFAAFFINMHFREKVFADIEIEHFLYTIDMQHTPTNTKISILLEDSEESSLGKSYVGASVYIFTKYLKNRYMLDYGWQKCVNVRDSGLVKVLNADFGMGDAPYAEADITDIYYNTEAFKVVQASYKNVTPTTVTFTAETYLRFVLIAVVSYGDDPDEEALYNYLDGTTQLVEGRENKDRFYEDYVTVWCQGGEYSLDDGETWYPCGTIDKDDNVNATFNLADFNVGDKITFRGVYGDGEYTEPISHVVSRLEVEVDPNGGNINGNTDSFTNTYYTDGSDGDNVYIARQCENVDALDKLYCERDGYEFMGFRIVKGTGTVFTTDRVRYMGCSRVYSIPRKRYSNVKRDLFNGLVEKCPGEEALTEYFVNYLDSFYGRSVSITVMTDETYLLKQSQTWYYVNSSEDYVKVQAVWKRINERNVTLIKIASAMYRNAMFKRTDGDERWYNESSAINNSTVGSRALDLSGNSEILHVKIKRSA